MEESHPASYRLKRNLNLSAGNNGAGEGNRTLTYSLGSYRSTTELLPLISNKLENSTALAAHASSASAVHILSAGEATC
jgi:hypothetical protein